MFGYYNPDDEESIRAQRQEQAERNARYSDAIDRLGRSSEANSGGSNGRYFKAQKWYDFMSSPGPKSRDLRNKEFFEKEGYTITWRDLMPGEAEGNNYIISVDAPVPVYNYDDVNMPDHEPEETYMEEVVYYEVPEVVQREESEPYVIPPAPVRKTKKVMKHKRVAPGLFARDTTLITDKHNGVVRYHLQPFDKFWKTMFGHDQRQIFGVQYNHNFEPWVNMWNGRKFMW